MPRWLSLLALAVLKAATSLVHDLIDHVTAAESVWYGRLFFLSIQEPSILCATCMISHCLGSTEVNKSAMSDPQNQQL